MNNKSLKKEVFKIYSKLPEKYLKELSTKCKQALDNGTCGVKCEVCCTVSHAFAIEKEVINNYIKENKLALPLISSNKEKETLAYHLPNTENQGMENIGLKKQTTKCKYFKNNRCLIYEVRPLNCRMTGLLEMQDCPIISEKEKMLSEEQIFDIILDLFAVNNKLMPIEEHIYMR